jgi:hypothetical protein
MAPDKSALRFSLGGRQRERVEVRAAGELTSDGWLPSEIFLDMGAFTGHFRANFLLAELKHFCADIGELYRRLEGAAFFEPIEGQLKLRLEVDQLGHVAISGSAMDVAGTGNRLTFSLMIDQSYLPALLKQLEATCA